MVREIRAYIEGGGPTNRTQSKLREGFDSFCRTLKILAAQREVSLRFIVAGSRDEAFHDFRLAEKAHPDAYNLLLVDSEAPVASLPRAHLQQRDGWDLANAKEDQIHLMVQCMETWLAADGGALAAFYGQGFNDGALPKRLNLEEEPKSQVFAALDLATRQTQKGTYGKIKHACELLRQVRPEKVQERCPHCRRFFETVTNSISGV